jgi:hypothetical protein
LFLVVDFTPGVTTTNLSREPPILIGVFDVIDGVCIFAVLVLTTYDMF